MRARQARGEVYDAGVQPYRDAPYHVQNAISVARRMTQPRDLLGWFVLEFRLEVPAAIHTGGVWRDRKRRGDPDGYQPVGGSILGAPRDAVPFQVFVEDDPFAVEVAEYEGHKDTAVHYAKPMRAAIASLAGRGRDSDPYPFMARTLYRTALMDGDWDAACRSMGIVEPVRRIYIDEALRRLWARYATEPPARTIRMEGVA
jgi:hypothetical protein